jgi:DcuC family C4-dicarboxylate transporter
VGTPPSGGGGRLRAAAEQADSFRVNLGKAFVPVLPLLLLLLAPFDRRLPKEFTEHVTILVAMLIGVTAAAITSPGLAGRLSGAFFEGAGYAYTHVISLIVTATIFAEGIKANGLIEIVANALSGQRIAAILASIGLPWLLATISGSGIGPAVAVMKALIPAADRMDLNPVRMGTVSAMSAHFGRTMSPAAAVVMMCVRLTTTEAEPVEPLDLVKRVAPPLFAGGVALFLCALLWR